MHTGGRRDSHRDGHTGPPGHVPTAAAPGHKATGRARSRRAACTTHRSGPHSEPQLCRQRAHARCRRLQPRASSVTAAFHVGVSPTEQCHGAGSGDRGTLRRQRTRWTVPEKLTLLPREMKTPAPQVTPTPPALPLQVPVACRCWTCCAHMQGCEALGALVLHMKHSTLSPL